MNTEFTENKYKKWYFCIVENSIKQNRIYDSNLHEKHHILPKSLGGTNNKDNIAILSFREHFICHLLLTKFTTSTNKQKMHHALRMMYNGSRLNDRKLTNKQYEICRLAFSKYKRKMSPQFCENKKINTIGEKNPMYGKKQTDRQKNICREKFSKKYDFLLDGQHISVVNLKKYCEENKLTRGKMSKLYYGKIKKYKNYMRYDLGNT